MIRTFRMENDTCRIEEGPEALSTAAAWIDLVHPDHEEERRVEAIVGAVIPTREEMAEIEATSRLYTERRAAVMTVPLLIRSASANPETTDVTFVLADRHLVTVRYGEPTSFATFAAIAARDPTNYATPAAIFVGLLEAIVDRLADVLEETGGNLDTLSRAAFAGPVGQGDHHASMRALGHDGEVVSKARENLVGLARLSAFARPLAPLRDPEIAQRLDGIGRDVEVLLDHAGALEGKITFLLDALLGMINIEQNAIIKTFSVVAVMFLPPTLIASIYGMNFAHMPELGMRYGYLVALLAMVVSMILPYAIFRRRGWI